MSNHFIIQIAGFYCIGLSVFHILFWRLFDWKRDLKKVSLANRAILQIANIQLIYFFLLVASICFVFTDELYQTALGKFFMLGMSMFWLVRTIQQFIFLRINHWAVNLLTIVFLFGCLIFALPLLI
ncbi:MAG: hypothetical protein ABI761_14095 [Saprospiraceae bacterium]